MLWPVAPSMRAKVTSGRADRVDPGVEACFNPVSRCTNPRMRVRIYAAIRDVLGTHGIATPSND